MIMKRYQQNHDYIVFFLKDETYYLKHMSDMKKEKEKREITLINIALSG